MKNWKSVQRFFSIIGYLFTLVLICLALSMTPHISNEVILTGNVSWTRADQRSLATAIESYRLDHGVYPIPEAGGFVPNSITTPVAYFTKVPADFFKVTYSPSTIYDYFILLKMKITLLVILIPLILIYCKSINSLITSGSTERKLILYIPLALCFVYLVFNNYKFLTEVFPRARLQKANAHIVSNRMGYATIDNLWVLHSWGPLQVPLLDNPSGLLYPGITPEELKNRVNALSYDPTNGATSQGDIFRINDY